ncbi:MAG: hypothetical protein L6R41_004341 [Letrouitia leprolyta]|nr:MAG: hypothetical protein L6R41_004341 [Letrouitia leprolyta]
MLLLHKPPQRRLNGHYLGRDRAAAPVTDIATHLAGAALTTMVAADVAMTVLALLVPRPAVSMVVHAAVERNVASQAARLKEPIAAAMATIANPATSVAETAAARQKVANVAPTQPIPCSEEIGSSGGGSTGGNSGGDTGGGNVPAPIPIPTLSIPDISIPTFDPSDYVIPTPTLPPIPTIPAAAASITSFTLPTITAESTPGAVLRTFSTYITIYYYTVFVVTTTFIRTETAYVTSSFTSTETQVTALATDSLDADIVFGGLALSILDAPTPTLTASNARDFSQTHRESTAASSAIVGGGAPGVGSVPSAAAGFASGAAGGKRGRMWDLGGVLLWGTVGLGAGLGMVLL